MPVLADFACSAYMAKSVIRRSGRTYNNIGDRCFAAAGPRLWNTLTAVKTVRLYGQLKRLLKTFFVWVVRPRRLVT